MAKELIRKLYEMWGQDDLTAIDILIAENYTVFSDPGDSWEGQTLNRDNYRSRLLFSRKAFPDLKFELSQSVHEGDRVAVIWRAVGTHLGDLNGIPPTGKKLHFSGQTVYLVNNGKVAGHWQTIDRLGFIQQLQPR